ncbi:hypothetical protein DFP72DRAFT_808842 [Ephemerocybe angulata]|uniref:CCHC-type domain-containing protein n=1 Tax=Ephemerocybe angulata TaxID=980116 RepID=A0A8H6I2X1_9AGAR|nr:hypothetical protein DFP72DRAFT_808842 [Tulosesus angulatus]
MRVTGQDTIQVELASDKDAQWLRTDGNMEKLGVALSGEIEEQTASMIIERIPITFNLATGIKEVEEANGYKRGDIISARWLKAEMNRYQGQLQAHAIVIFRNADTANRARNGRLVICGVMMTIRKDIKRPRPPQCYKSQLFGHYTKDCRSKTNICRMCRTSGHKTRECTTPQTRRCISCKGSNHASWDK